MRAINVMLLSFLVSTTAEAGAVLKVDSKDSSGKTLQQDVYYAQDGMMRIDGVDTKGVNSIGIVRDGVIWNVDPRHRTFTRIDAASAQQFFGASSSDIDAVLAELPPEQRAAMQAQVARMKKSAATEDYTFTDTGRSDHSGQYSCHVWTEQRAGRPYAEYCIVSTSSLPSGSELAASMKKAFATTNQLLAGNPMLAKQGEQFIWLEKMHGFPARWHRVSPSGAAEDEHVLSSAEAQSLPADKFAIPQGFREQPLGGDAH